MSRSNYSDDLDTWALIRWRGAVAAAIRGKRGQELLLEMATALDAMPAKRLIANELISKEGEVCALGAVAKHKALDVAGLDPEESEKVAAAFNIAEALACEIVAENDDSLYDEQPEHRWQRMRKWVAENLKKPVEGGAA